MNESSPQDRTAPRPVFTSYQIFVVALLAFLQFTVVLDFMILSPLSAILLKELSISTAQFGRVVSAYAFSAGVSALLAAGFADRFDRKKILLFFYAGFIIGTLFCGLAPNYHALLAARVFTGFFGGVITSISLAIVADLFHLSQRGRVMGFVQSAFAASQIMGIPLGLYVATHYGWHFPFLMIVAVSLVVGSVVIARLRPIAGHLQGPPREHTPWGHLWRTATRPRYQAGFAATLLLTTGGFMLMPFGAAYMTGNLGVDIKKLPMVYMVTGVCTLLAGPLLGKLSDHVGKFRTFLVGSLLGIPIMVYFTSMGAASLWFVIAVNIVMFVAITSRTITAAALNSAVPDLQDRGAYMSVNSALQQFSGGVAAWVAGLIVVQRSSGFLDHYPRLGWVVASAMIIVLPLMFNVHRITHAKN
jgi:predicted MFS family arabinose efflux permease